MHGDRWRSYRYDTLGRWAGVCGMGVTARPAMDGGTAYGLPADARFQVAQTLDAEGFERHALGEYQLVLWRHAAVFGFLQPKIVVMHPSTDINREKLILAGLYLSRYDSRGLEELGFSSFVEAFNVIGYSLGSKPASIKNYRDEFDPLHPNSRRGWHKRPVRDYCLQVYERYKDLDFESFTAVIKAFLRGQVDVWEEGEENTRSYFANRLITGLAAERYFESIQASLPEFENYSFENTTHLGCGYDFRLRNGASKDFLAVEVKGLRERTGGVSLTPKEHAVAGDLKGRYFLFVVKNFRESPTHENFRDPLSGRLQFKKHERVVVQVSWLTSV
ncbi:MAG: DUF3883 domain-containing protein [Bryobacteraceae bacterium]